MRSALEERSVDVIGIADTGADAIEATRRLRPDVVLMDVGLPDRSGIDVGAEIVAERPDAKVVALTALEDAQVAKDALGVGFRGYMTKGSRVSQVVTSLAAIMEGQTVMATNVAKVPKRSPDGDSMALVLASQLTERELEVLRLLARGTASRDISRRLRIAPNTVRTHVQSILAKLQVHSRLEAAAFAVRHRVVDVTDRSAAHRHDRG
jgi:two-component system nitrate/nitrite response regulator NarL